jgi:AbrB family looped-hinge helix DNA binding protein
MRITSKGQVTIPKHIREKLGVRPGDEIGFREDGQAVILEAPAQRGEEVGERFVRKLAEFGEKMRREGKVDPYWANKTTDEIMEELRGYSEDANDPGFKRIP